MKEYSDRDFLNKNLEINFFNELGDEIKHQLDGSILKNNKFNERWLEKHEWKACYSFNGDPSWYDVLSLIRYCRNIGVKKLISIPVDFLIGEESQSNDFRIFSTSLKGFSQALWGIHDANEKNSFYDRLYKASLEPCVMLPDAVSLEFCVVRELGVGIFLAGPCDFLEFIVSRSKIKWYRGVLQNNFAEAKEFIPLKDRKAAIREEKGASKKALLHKSSLGSR